MNTVLENTRRVLASVKTAFSYLVRNEYRLPQTMVDAMSSVWVDDNVQSFTRGKNEVATGSAVREVLTFAAVLAGVAVSAEVIAEISDSIIDRLAY